MVVYFNEPTIIKQHGCIQECMFVECVGVDFVMGKAVIRFDLKNDSDFSIVPLTSLFKAE